MKFHEKFTTPNFLRKTKMAFLLSIIERVAKQWCSGGDWVNPITHIPRITFRATVSFRLD